MLVEERRTRLAEIVRQKGFAPLPDLATALRVSESTVRRDLEFLEDQGTAKRTHGGVFYTGPAPGVAQFEQRQPAEWQKKRQIARVMAALIKEGETLLLDGGSTTYEVARLLVGRSLQIVTNSLPVANLFAADTRAEVVLIGGVLDPRTGVSQGDYAQRMIGGIRANRTILSVSGINETGLFNNSLRLVQTEQAMMQSGDEVCIVADSSKFGHASLVRLCELADIDMIVTDSEIAEPWADLARQCGVAMQMAQAAAADEVNKSAN